MICKKVYASKEYSKCEENDYRIPDEIDVNSPDILPTLIQNNGKFDISLPSDYFKNKNYPIGNNVVSSYNSITVAFLRGSKKPTYIPKRMPFLLISHNDKIEDAHLIML